MDVEKCLVTVKSAVDVTELRSYFKDDLRKDVEIVDPVEVEIPAMKENSAAYKREEDADINIKKERDNETSNKKDKGSTPAFDMKYRGDREEDEDKYGGINGEKVKGGGRETIPNVFCVDGAGKERGRGEGSGSSKKDEDRDGTRFVNGEIYCSCDNHMYDGWCDLPTVNDLDGHYQMFSDENPRSCCIM